MHSELHEVRSSAAGPEIGQPHYGGTLRFLGPGGVDHLDTASAYYATSGQILRALTRQLFSYPASQDLSDPQKSFTPAPDIATEIPTQANGGISLDRLTYTIHLRNGVCWDTTPPREVTAQDFIRGLKRLGNPVAGAGARHYFTSTIVGMKEHCDAYDKAFEGRKPTAADLAWFQNSVDIVGLRAPDDKTLIIKLKQPANDFLNVLAMGFASAAPQEYDKHLPDSEEFRRDMPSNGPYRLAKYGARGGEMRLERNPAWLQETDPIRHQYVDAIEIRTATETVEAMLAKIDSGEIDLAWSFTAVSWAKPAEGLDAFPRSYPGFALNPYLVFNLQSPNQNGAIKNLKVRQAIAYAIDRIAISRILEVLEGVPNFPLHSAIPPGSVGHRKFNPYPTPNGRGDPVKARQLLEEAGYADGLTLIAAVRQASLHLDIMKSVASDLEKCGIKLSFLTCDQATYYGSLLSDPANAKAGKWDIAEPGWTPDWWGNNGRAIVQPLFQTNCSAGTTNYGCYSNPRVDQLIEHALQEDDPEKAEASWHEVDVQVMKDLPIVPILAFAAMTSRYHSRRVRNAIHVPQIEFFDITNLWLDPLDDPRRMYDGIRQPTQPLS
ncbi:ABC transporter substrate-binding protein [Bradyrhizobium sp. AUGA SZCCT0431]|uniref:ABC transporter substrate-binding protein n=1 Tax=Bradyrhizobium sp. AUGA SZCCT0431 TaxID=2807674 RepID=UPI001BA67B36|nr:ABC transporter substrate-binding protein [Bradyrhizobium sp. AUGA SZCCT0431]MBR1147534.1 ABC transporter substrate-binding protein [Bradyrhizobium sp. AUGA SZCCT0431]